MAVFQEEYSDAETNSGTIATGASVTFFGAGDPIAKRDRYGSSNVLVLTSAADEAFAVDLDGIAARRLGILSPRGSIVIKAEEGLFFDTVKLTNLDAGTTSASEIKIRRARAKRIGA